jgi:hypothetical protein
MVGVICQAGRQILPVEHQLTTANTNEDYDLPGQLF